MMDMLIDLWLPILVSAVAIFILSFVAWVVMPHHKTEWVKLPDEERFKEAIRGMNIPPGNYIFPGCAKGEDMNSEAFKERYSAGPWGTLMVWRGQPSMGRNLALSFLVYFIISVFVGYVGVLGAEPGMGFSEVFQITGTAAIMAYTFGALPGMIWFGATAKSFINHFADCIVYGAVTGAIFGWLWPAAASLPDALPAVGG
ncbi:MAG: hypothetical protein ACF8PN_08570 [Phycisphaerales bacterium]